MQENDGSIPSAVTFETTRSVSVAAARVCGMDEDRVQFPDGPLKWAGMFQGGDRSLQDQ